MSSNVKYNLPIKNSNQCIECINCKNTSCNKCTRNRFINDCLPLVDMKESRINILNWDHSRYIWFDESNTQTYSINKDFSLSEYTGDIINYQIFYQTELINNINNDFIIYIEGVKFSIPIYYFFINKNNVIFNVFISFYLYKNPEYKKNTILSFNYNVDNNNYVSMTYKFDIFNVSLLCDKFFEIIPLFLYDYEPNAINCKLREIFSEFALDKLYNIINSYKGSLFAYNSKSSQNTEKYEKYEKFISGPIKSSQDRESNPYTIKKLESGDKTKNINELYNDLTESIRQYRIYLSELTCIIRDFDKIFIVSILDFRFKQTTIMNTWAFDKYFNLNHILGNVSQQPGHNKKLLKSCYTIDKPIIYEYSTITYKNMNYGNCMENTILQFLKILLWNNDIDNYNLDLIDKCFKKNDCINKRLYDIFSKIDKEKTVDFDYEWVKFIMELNKENKYQLIKLEVELNPTLYNLITFLKYISIDEINEIDNNDFLLNFVKKINKEFCVKVDSTTYTDKIILTTNKTYTMFLNHYKHAYFENAKLSDLSTNILEKISKSNSELSVYLRNNKTITYSEINNFICLDYIENKDPFYNYYISKLEKTKIMDSYYLLCRDEAFYKINELIYLKLLSNHIACFLNLQNNNEDSVWHIAVMCIKSEYFWNQVIVKNLCGDNWNLQNNYKSSVWHNAVESIKYDHFWDQVIVKNLCGDNWNLQNNYKSSVWHNAVKSIKSDHFWDQVIVKNLCGDNWNLQNDYKSSVWHNAVESIKYDHFWDQVIVKNLCGDNWNLQNDDEYTVWHNAVKSIESDYFWDQVIVKNLCGDNWNLQDYDLYTVWHNAVKSIESDYFWNQVIDKNLCGDNWNLQDYKDESSVWHFATSIKSEESWDRVSDKNIKSKYFWDQVIVKNLCGDDWNLQDRYKSSVWHNAVKSVESDYFWDQVIVKNLCGDNWNLQNDVGFTVWHNAVKSIKYDHFWDQVIVKNLCGDNWNLQNDERNSVWHLAISNIESYYFWDQVIRKKLFEKWYIGDLKKFIGIDENKKYICIVKEHLKTLEESDKYGKKNLKFKTKYIKYKLKYLELKKIM
jgi:hypothetical protein